MQSVKCRSNKALLSKASNGNLCSRVVLFDGGRGSSAIVWLSSRKIRLVADCWAGDMSGELAFRASSQVGLPNFFSDFCTLTKTDGRNFFNDVQEFDVFKGREPYSTKQCQPPAKEAPALLGVSSVSCFS